MQIVASEATQRPRVGRGTKRSRVEANCNAFQKRHKGVHTWTGRSKRSYKNLKNGVRARSLSNACSICGQYASELVQVSDDPPMPLQNEIARRSSVHNGDAVEDAGSMIVPADPEADLSPPLKYIIRPDKLRVTLVDRQLFNVRCGLCHKGLNGFSAHRVRYVLQHKGATEHVSQLDKKVRPL